MAGQEFEFVTSRVLDAPRALVWKAWTDAEVLAQWFSPAGFTTRVLTLDLKPGGLFHYEQSMPGGHKHYGRFIYKEIVAPEKLVVIVSFSDEKAGITRHPMAPQWPAETISTTTFEEVDGGKKTKLTVRWKPYNASDEEKQIFEAGAPGMEQGWGGTLKQLEDYLAKIQGT